MTAVRTGSTDGEGPEGLARRVADLVSADPQALTDGELVDLVVGASQVQARLAASEHAVVDSWDRSMLWTADGARSPVAWIAARTEWSAGEAAAMLRRVRALRSMPHATESFGAGRIGVAKVSALVNARDGVEDLFAAHEEWLVAQVEQLTVAQAQVVARAWHRRAEAEIDAGTEPKVVDALGANRIHLSRLFDGRWKLDGDLDEETGARLEAMLAAEMAVLFRKPDPDSDPGGAPAAADAAADRDAPAARLTPAERRGWAFGEIVRHGGPSELTDRGQAAVTLVVDVDTAKGRPITGPDDLARRRNELGGSPLADAAIRRILCDADLSVLLVDGQGEPLNVGRTYRLPTKAQRKALAARDRGCVFPGCSVPPSRCEAHHLVDWHLGGQTDIEDMVLFCSFHHHCVHEGCFVCTRTNHRVQVWRPDGTPVAPARHGQLLFADPDPAVVPPPVLAHEPDELARRRAALRHPPPPPAPPPRFSDPALHQRALDHTERRRSPRDGPGG